jgi:hypothetical protein
MIEVLSIRYMQVIPILNKIPYNYKLGLHIVTGIIMFFLIVAFIVTVSGDNSDDIHVLTGRASAIISFFIVLNGFINWGIKGLPPNKCWNFFRRLQIPFIHKYLGYILIIFSQLVTLNGVQLYIKKYS